MVTSRQDSTAIGIVASTVSVHKTSDTFAKKEEKKLEMEYGHTSTSQLRISVLASTGRVQVTKKCHENSGGYACVYCLLWCVRYYVLLPTF